MWVANSLPFRQVLSLLLFVQILVDYILYFRASICSRFQVWGSRWLACCREERRGAKEHQLQRALVYSWKYSKFNAYVIGSGI